MRVSIDGLRRNMGEAYRKTVNAYREAVAENGLDDSFEQIKEGLEEMRCIIGAFMCVYADNPEDMMSNMADYADTLPWPDPDDEDD